MLLFFIWFISLFLSKFMLTVICIIIRTLIQQRHEQLKSLPLPMASIIYRRKPGLKVELLIMYFCNNDCQYE